MNKKLAFKAFLSHRYKSPEINLYFYGAFSEVAEVQFDVDEGNTQMSVTRLERLIRDADAFIGVYSYGGKEQLPKVEDLRKTGHYFRLEMDLAVRLGRPAIVFYDRRFRDTLRIPSDIFQHPYDAQEILLGGEAPSFDRHVGTFQQFCGVVTASMSYESRAANPRAGRATGVGILSVDDDLARTIQGVLERQGYGSHRFDGSQSLNAMLVSKLRSLDWVIVEWVPAIERTGLPAALHGLGIPVLRLKRDTGKRRRRSALERTLFGEYKVGYNEDLVLWNDLESLESHIPDIVAYVMSGGRRINTTNQANEYFQSAVRRSEKIFLSFAGEDLEHATPCREELLKRFESVYFYKDPKSVPAGLPWARTQMGSLTKADVGVVLLSRNWLKSKNCRLEGQTMVGEYDRGILIYVVNLDGVEAPPELKAIQWQDRPSKDKWHTVPAGVIKALDSREG